MKHQKAAVRTHRCQWCGRIGTRGFSTWNGKPQCRANWACADRAAKNRQTKKDPRP